MLKKGFRITKKEDFDRVFRSGKPLFFGEIACRFAKNDSHHIRIGFSFSKKHLPLAVDRNRQRRVLSEALTSLETDWPTDVDIVFFSTKKMSPLHYDQAEKILKKAIKYIYHS